MIKNIFIFLLIISLSGPIRADHTKFDQDALNLMSPSTSSEIGINYFKSHEYGEALEYFKLRAKEDDTDNSVNAGLKIWI